MLKEFKTGLAASVLNISHRPKGVPVAETDNPHDLGAAGEFRHRAFVRVLVPRPWRVISTAAPYGVTSWAREADLSERPARQGS